jgi:alanine dehydrogenase
VRFIGDISCDILGGIPCNLRASHLDAPFYDISPITFDEQPVFSNTDNITLLAVDNLPSALPYEASKDFGKQLIQHVIPLLLEGDKNNTLQRATITQNGELMPSFQHLL